jgi:hypothetical protein
MRTFGVFQLNYLLWGVLLEVINLLIHVVRNNEKQKCKTRGLDLQM